MELENSNLSIFDLLKQNEFIIMRVGELSNWDLDTMFNMHQIKNLMHFIDFDIQDYSEDELLETIDEFKDSVREYYRQQIDKCIIVDIFDMAIQIDETWNETLPDELLAVILARAMLNLEKKESRLLMLEEGEAENREEIWRMVNDTQSFEDFDEFVGRDTADLPIYEISSDDEFYPIRT